MTYQKFRLNWLFFHWVASFSLKEVPNVFFYLTLFFRQWRFFWKSRDWFWFFRFVGTSSKRRETSIIRIGNVSIFFVSVSVFDGFLEYVFVLFLFLVFFWAFYCFYFELFCQFSPKINFPNKNSKWRRLQRSK